MFTFLKKHDLSLKILIPFTTHEAQAWAIACRISPNFTQEPPSDKVLPSMVTMPKPAKTT